MSVQVTEIAERQRFSQTLGFQLVSTETDHAVLKLPYGAHLGIERVNGGAISSLVDTAATCAFWSHPNVGSSSRGATIGFAINFLQLVVAEDLWASARVRRRGGSICVGDVSVTNAAEQEVAIATVTYKLNP
ncbi:MAG: hypothetical protein ACI915_004594 [Gammaproteobacteria bacterium]|jgi:uncharacterized protein (TIGR00369 family)